MDEVPIDRLDLRDDPEVVSTPTILPAYACGTAVTVTGFVPRAFLELEIDGTLLPPAQAGFPDPVGYTFSPVGPLVAGQLLRARQIVNGVPSGWATETVRDHREEFPSGPPRPQISPDPVFECGSRTGVANLLVGCNVWITADATEVGRVNGATAHQGVNVNPDYGPNQRVRAWAELCGDPSPPSTEYIAGSPPNPLPKPGVDPVYDGAERIRVNNLVNGARFTVDRGGAVSGPFRTWGFAHFVDMTALVVGEAIKAAQTMCPFNPPSDPGGTTVQPCSAMPAPQVAPIQAGDTTVVVTSWVAGAWIKVYQNGVSIGFGGPPLVKTAPIAAGAPVYVQQGAGTCRGSTVRQINPRCVAPPTGADPAGLDLFPVGEADFADGPVKGSVFYPAQDDGPGQPFNPRQAALGRCAIVFMAHGNHPTNHDPADRNMEVCGQPAWPEIRNHTGYRYLQRQLARIGIVAVSVDCNATNCVGNSAPNIDQRADLIMGAISHFQGLDAGGDPIFGGRIDFTRVGLLGHSRGGEAVVVVGNQAGGALGVRIRAIISLAPTNSFGHAVGDVAFMTILPASDGDVSGNGGARLYDVLRPRPFKSQVYIDFANHNYFNREWVNDEDNRLPPDILDRSTHERMLSGYAMAFYRSFLLDHPLTDYLTFRLHPPGFDPRHVHLSFEWQEQLTVDDHEQPNDIVQNTVNQPTAQSAGLTVEEYELWQGAADPPPVNTFFGRSRGMVLDGSGDFRTQLGGGIDLRPETGREIWLRVAEVANSGRQPPDRRSF